MSDAEEVDGLLKQPKTMMEMINHQERAPL
jgi:hypothetical protein